MLYDDGLHNDGLADDGVYGNDLLPGDVPGGYEVRLDVRGNANSGAAFTRMAWQRLHVTTDLPHVDWNSPDIPKAIDDYVSTTSTLTIDRSLVIADLDVELDISHSYCSDLDVFLIAPDGTRVELFTDVGGGSDNFTRTRLDDSAATWISDASAPFTGSFRPEESLRVLNGLDAQGTWTLEISDDSGGDTGRINGWALAIAAPSAAPQLEVLAGGTPLPHQGNLDFGTADGGASGPVRTLTIRNNNTESLNLSGFVLPDGFRLIEAPYGVISPGTSRRVAIQLEPTTIGEFRGPFTFLATTDGSESVAFSLDLHGVVMSPASPNRVPEIGWFSSTLVGNTLELTAGDVRDADGSVVEIAFYSEANGRVGLQTGPAGDRPLGTQPDPSTLVVRGVPLDSLPAGLNTLYSQARDDDGHVSVVAYTSELIPRDGPLLLALESGRDTVYQPEDHITLSTAPLHDPAHPVSEVRFHLESNGVPGLQVDSDLLIGVDSSDTDGWQTSVSSTSVPSGTHTFYAQGSNLSGETSNIVSAVVTVMDSRNPWQNQSEPLDVTGDGNVHPIDALLVINELNAPGHTDANQKLPVTRPADAGFLDVDGDGHVFPIDALLVINFLNAQLEAEGESAATMPFVERAESVPPLESSAIKGGRSAERRAEAEQGAVGRDTVVPSHLRDASVPHVQPISGFDPSGQHPSRKGHLDMVFSEFTVEVLAEDLLAVLI